MTQREIIIRELQRVVSKLYPSASATLATIEHAATEEAAHYVTSTALSVAKVVSMPPYAVAESLAKEIRLASMQSVTATQQGYIYFQIKDSWLAALPKKIMLKKRTWAASMIGKNARVNVQCAVVHPTGPLTLVDSRGIFLGDILVKVLMKAGYKASREYFINDVGDEVNILAESVLRKYFKRLGIPMEYPEYCYQNSYIDDLAKGLHIPNYNIAKNNFTIIRDKIKDRLVAQVLKKIKESIKQKIGIRNAVYYSKKKLFVRKGAIERTVSLLREDDRLLQKGNNEPSQLLVEIAYRAEKFLKRKYDTIIDISGFNNDAVIPFMDTLDFKGRCIQMHLPNIQLMHDGEKADIEGNVQMPDTIEKVISKVGLDAIRYYLLMHADGTHMDFDLNLAKEQGEKNPVYYIQYAHARMCSILKMVKSKKARPLKTAVLRPNARRLLALMLKWPEVIEDAATSHALQRIPLYAFNLARSFHNFYDSERVMTSDGSCNVTLLAAVEAAQVVFQDVLAVMGISAPTSMTK
jgi:arginyl-tRNA synthetase